MPPPPDKPLPEAPDEMLTLDFRPPPEFPGEMLTLDSRPRHALPEAPDEMLTLDFRPPPEFPGEMLTLDSRPRPAPPEFPGEMLTLDSRPRPALPEAPDEMLTLDIRPPPEAPGEMLTLDIRPPPEFPGEMLTLDPRPRPALPEAPDEMLTLDIRPPPEFPGEMLTLDPRPRPALPEAPGEMLTLDPRPRPALPEAPDEMLTLDIRPPPEFPGEMLTLDPRPRPALPEAPDEMLTLDSRPRPELPEAPKLGTNVSDAKPAAALETAAVEAEVVAGSSETLAALRKTAKATGQAAQKFFTPAFVAYEATMALEKGWGAVDNAKADGNKVNPGSEFGGAVAEHAVSLMTEPLAELMQPTLIPVRTGTPLDFIPLASTLANAATGGRLQKAVEAVPGKVAKAVGSEEVARGHYKQKDPKFRNAAMEILARAYPGMTENSLESLPAADAQEKLSRASGQNGIELDKAEKRLAASWIFTTDRAEAYADVKLRKEAKEGFIDYQAGLGAKIAEERERAKALGHSVTGNQPDSIKGTGKETAMPLAPGSVVATGASTTRTTILG